MKLKRLTYFVKSRIVFVLYRSPQHTACFSSSNYYTCIFWYAWFMTDLYYCTYFRYSFNNRYQNRIFYVQLRTESGWKLLLERAIVCCTAKRVQIALTLRIVACGTKLALCQAGFIVFQRLFRKIRFYLVDLRQELFVSKAYVFCDHLPLNSTLSNWTLVLISA